MASWATNIVRLPLKLSAAQALDKQIVEFPAEFMLFVNHIGQIELSTSTQEATRTIALACEDRMWKLDDSGKTTSWMVVNQTHTLSPEAKADSRSLDNAVRSANLVGGANRTAERPRSVLGFLPDTHHQSASRNSERALEDERRQTEYLTRCIQRRVDRRGRSHRRRSLAHPSNRRRSRQTLGRIATPGRGRRLRTQR